MDVTIRPHSNFPEIYWIIMKDNIQKLGTKNLVPGRTVYGESLVRSKRDEFRIWDAHRSKLAATIVKGSRTVTIRPNYRVLYLGAASGTTPSHISDIVGEKGYVYCVEFASRSFRDLVNNVAVFRYNMIPILADARLPESYLRMVEYVDTIYCDIAQPEQARILADNADMFLDYGSWIMLAIKAQSIDVIEEPSVIFNKEIEILKSRGFHVEQVVNIEPFDKAHVMVIAQKVE